MTVWGACSDVVFWWGYYLKYSSSDCFWNLNLWSSTDRVARRADEGIEGQTANDFIVLMYHYAGGLIFVAFRSVFWSKDAPLDGDGPIRHSVAAYKGDDLGVDSLQVQMRVAGQTDTNALW